jgi:hypothetical protein
MLGWALLEKIRGQSTRSTSRIARAKAIYHVDLAGAQVVKGADCLGRIGGHTGPAGTAQRRAL